MSNKERLDILLVNRGLFESREKANGWSNLYGYNTNR